MALAYGLVGKHLVTVEGLMEGDKLHPSQKAMVLKMVHSADFVHLDLSCPYLLYIKIKIL